MNPTAETMGASSPPLSMNAPQTLTKQPARSQAKLPSAEERLELILLGLGREQSVEELCRQAGVSRELFYRWMQRVRQSSLQALAVQNPGPKKVKSVEQASRKIEQMNQRVKRLEQQTAALRKERDHLKVVNQVARRIITRRRWDPGVEHSKKKSM